MGVHSFVNSSRQRNEFLALRHGIGVGCCNASCALELCRNLRLRQSMARRHRLWYNALQLVEKCL